MLAIESMLDQLTIRVDLVEDRISVGTFTCSKGDYLKVLAHSLKETNSKRSNRDICFFYGLIECQVDLHVLGRVSYL